jgi:hypothetical protein
MHSSYVRQAILLGVAVVGGVAAGGCGASAQPEGEPTASTAAALTSGATAFASINYTSPGQPFIESNSSYNSARGTNSVTQSGTGQFHVLLGKLGSPWAGDVQVGSVGPNGIRCNVVGWSPSGTNLDVDVDCFDGYGHLANNPFNLAYQLRTDHPGAEGAYVSAFNKSSQSYDATSSFSWNSTNQGIKITHTPGTGQYFVEFLGQSLSDGTVEVTAYGAGTNSFCKTVTWNTDTVEIQCYDGGGNFADSEFDAIWESLAPNNTSSYTYLWADQPTATNYHPNSIYERGFLASQCGGAAEPNATIQRNGVGEYTVTLPGMGGSAPWPAIPIVVAYGNGDNTSCFSEGYYISGSDIHVDVACDNGFTPADSRFTLAYLSVLDLIC